MSLIPTVVWRNKAAVAALRIGDRNGAIEACQRDAGRIDSLLTQISNQYEAVTKTLEQERGFAEDIARDPEIFAAACREASQ